MPEQTTSAAAAGGARWTGIRTFVGSGTFLLAAGSAAALAYIARGTSGAVGLPFAQDALRNVADVLTPLILVSLFLERAVEVVVSAWRDHGARALREGVKHAEPGSGLHAARALQKYKVDTMRIAFIVSFSLAFFAALVGVRAVSPLLAPSLSLPDAQALWFARFDIVITALLLGGGADGIHQIISTFTDFLDRTRTSLQAPATAAPAPAAAAPAPVAAAPAPAPAAAAPVAASPAPADPGAAQG